MNSKALVRAAAVVLTTALFTPFAVHAQAQPQTMVDTEPLPASERNSVGAVILMEQPVLAQREAMQNLAARAPDTSTLGAGPARVLQRALTKDESEKQEREKKTK